MIKTCGILCDVVWCVTWRSSWHVTLIFLCLFSAASHKWFTRLCLERETIITLRAYHNIASPLHSIQSILTLIQTQTTTCTRHMAYELDLDLFVSFWKPSNPFINPTYNIFWWGKLLEPKKGRNRSYWFGIPGCQHCITIHNQTIFISLCNGESSPSFDNTAITDNIEATLG